MHQPSFSWLTTIVLPLVIGLVAGLLDVGSSVHTSLLFGLAVGSIWLVVASGSGSFYLTGLLLSYYVMGAPLLIVLFIPLGLLVAQVVERLVDKSWSTPLIGSLLYVVMVWLLGLLLAGVPAVTNAYFIGSVGIGVVCIVVGSLLMSRQTLAR